MMVLKLNHVSKRGQWKNDHCPWRHTAGADRTQVGPVLAPWTLLSGLYLWYNYLVFQEEVCWLSSSDVNSIRITSWQPLLLIKINIQVMTWISHTIHMKLWHFITRPCYNFCTVVEVGAWLSNYIPQKTMDISTYVCCNIRFFCLSNRNHRYDDIPCEQKKPLGSFSR